MLVWIVNVGPPAVDVDTSTDVDVECEVDASNEVVVDNETAVLATMCGIFDVSLPLQGAVSVLVTSCTLVFLMVLVVCSAIIQVSVLVEEVIKTQLSVSVVVWVERQLVFAVRGLMEVMVTVTFGKGTSEAETFREGTEWADIAATEVLRVTPAPEERVKKVTEVGGAGTVLVKVNVTLRVELSVGEAVVGKIERVGLVVG